MINAKKYPVGVTMRPFTHCVKALRDLEDHNDRLPLSKSESSDIHYIDSFPILFHLAIILFLCLILFL